MRKHTTRLAMPDKIRMLIDCDAGVDDAEAVAVALSNQHVEVLGITCVNGTTEVKNVCRNVLRLLKVYDREQIPVFEGCATPLLNTKVLTDEIHGKDGFGDVPDLVDPNMSLLKSEHAVNAIVRIVNEYQGEISMVTLGPLTNVAMAMRMDPDLPKKLKDLTIMGGNSNAKGNFTVSGEFNFAMDPEAAHIVLNSIESPATIVTSDVCEEHPLTQSWFGKRLAIGSEKANFLKAISKKLESFFYKIYGKGPDCPYLSWDSLAMIARVRSDAVLESERFYANVELDGKLTRAQMIIDWRGSLGKQANVNIVKKLDMNIIQETMLNSVM
ncbi:inosine-uridine preferring nucleoside hydrolase-like [Ptychodera flava]|uniref:inosine-uridine preferring nucleoside hydrolase-like n=1 Tax=Ptychodera flava TaxID=63121 RepID=UPI00396A6743